jgi:hypothetical protein
MPFISLSWNSGFHHILTSESNTFSITVLNQLGQVDVIIGEYRPGVDFWAQNHDVPYILTAPLPVKQERRLKRVPMDKRVVFSAWPSIDDFYALTTKVLNESRVARGKRINNLGKLLIFRQGLDMESLSGMNTAKSYIKFTYYVWFPKLDTRW